MQQDSQDETQKNVLIADLPLLPIPRGNAGATMLAELLMGKYMHHLPFHRQIAIFKLAGVSLPASTINGWTKDSCDLLRSLYHQLREIVLETDYIQVDESTVPVIDNEKQKAVKAYLWMVGSVEKNLVFCGNHEAAGNSAVLYSLLGCCKAHDVNPREWLIDVLTRIPAYNKDYSLDLAELLPHNWKISKNGQDITTKLN